MKTKMLLITLIAALAAFPISGCGCSGDVNTEAVITKSEEIPQMMTEEEIKNDDSREASTEEIKAIEEAIPLIKGLKVIRNAKNVDLTKYLNDNDNLIKDVQVAKTDLKTTRTGTYDVEYKVTIYDGTKDTSGNRNTISVLVNEKVTVIEKEEADRLTKEGETVLSSKGDIYVPVSDETDASNDNIPSDTKEKPDTEVKKEEAADNKQQTGSTTGTAQGTSGTTGSNQGTTSGTTSGNNAGTTSGASTGSSGSSGSSGTSTGTNQGTTGTTSGTTGTTGSSSGTGGTTQKPTATPTPSHTHSWIPVTTTVHHDAVYENRWVQDSAAYDEQVLVKEAWDEEVDTTTEENHTFCGACGMDFTANGFSQSEVTNHCKQHALNGESSRYYSADIEIPITIIVHHDAEYKTVHHEATGHYEQVLVKAAYDETVTTGYRCSCGATK